MAEQRLTFTVSEIAELLGVGRNLAYDLCNAGHFPVLRHGRRLLVPKQAFLRWVNAEEGIQA